MAQAKEPIDKVRASRDGHEFHEAWTARAAMRLLLPHDDLVGIAVEGLEPGDQTSTSAQTVEVADLTFYYGNAATFNSAKRIEIAQLKYSIRSQDREFRARHAKKTIELCRPLRGNSGSPTSITKGLMVPRKSAINCSSN